MMAPIDERLSRIDERLSVFQSRLASLDERVFVSQSNELEKLAIEVKALNARLNYLIVLLVGNFGFAFVKAFPALAHLL